MLCVGLSSLADIWVESDDDKKGEDLDCINDLEVRVDRSVDWILFVVSKFEDLLSL